MCKLSAVIAGTLIPPDVVRAAYAHVAPPPPPALSASSKGQAPAAKVAEDPEVSDTLLGLMYDHLSALGDVDSKLLEDFRKKFAPTAAAPATLKAVTPPKQLPSTLKTDAARAMPHQPTKPPPFSAALPMPLPTAAEARSVSSSSASVPEKLPSPPLSAPPPPARRKGGFHPPALKRVPDEAIGRQALQLMGIDQYQRIEAWSGDADAVNCHGFALRAAAMADGLPQLKDCEPIPPEEVVDRLSAMQRQRTVAVFRDNDGQIAHTAVAQQDGSITHLVKHVGIIHSGTPTLKEGTSLATRDDVLPTNASVPADPK